MLERSAKCLDPEDHKVRMTYSGSNNTEINFASGTNEFRHVWDDRATYDYS